MFQIDGPRLHFFMKAWRRERDGNNKSWKRKKKNPHDHYLQKESKKNKKPKISFQGEFFSPIIFMYLFLSHYNHRVHAILFSFPHWLYYQEFFPHCWESFMPHRRLLLFSVYVILTLKLYNDATFRWLVIYIDRLIFEMDNFQINYTDFVFLNVCSGKCPTPI